MACLQKGRGYGHLGTLSVVMETVDKIESAKKVICGVICLFILQFLHFHGITFVGATVN